MSVPYAAAGTELAPGQPMNPQSVVVAGASAGVGRAYAGGRAGAAEVWVGFPTVKAIVGDMLAPALLDRMLARAGYDAQQTSEPEDAARPHNLWEPVSGNHGAHGRLRCARASRECATVDRGAPAPSSQSAAPPPIGLAAAARILRRV